MATLQDLRPTGFARVDHAVYMLMASGQLTPSEYLVYAAIAHHADGGRSAFPSVTRLAKHLRLRRHTVIACVASLQRLGLLACKKQRGRHTVYQLLPTEHLTGVPRDTTEQTTGVSRDTTTSVPRDTTEQTTGVSRDTRTRRMDGLDGWMDASPLAQRVREALGALPVIWPQLCREYSPEQIEQARAATIAGQPDDPAAYFVAALRSGIDEAAAAQAAEGRRRKERTKRGQALPVIRGLQRKQSFDDLIIR